MRESGGWRFQRVETAIERADIVSKFLCAVSCRKKRDGMVVSASELLLVGTYVSREVRGEESCSGFGESRRGMNIVVCEMARETGWDVGVLARRAWVDGTSSLQGIKGKPLRTK